MFDTMALCELVAFFGRLLDILFGLLSLGGFPNPNIAPLSGTSALDIVNLLNAILGCSA